MPKSRKRPGAKKRRRGGSYKIPTDIAKFFEDISVNPEKDLPYPVLYHYTSREAALAILSCQRFWATAHDCTNDENELISANAVVIEVAKAQRKNAKGIVAAILDRFIKNYSAEMLAKIRTAYLTCFSTVRDDKNQWADYGGNGKGVCLGVKVINEPEPSEPDIFSRQMEVIYSEDSLRKWFSDTLAQMCSRLELAGFSANNLRLGLSIIYGVAAFASIIAKDPKWESEKEVRRVTLSRFEPGVKPMVRVTADGKEKRYLAPFVRAEDKLIALDEIIIGANQNVDETRKQIEAVLAAKGYTEGSIEYPRFSISTILPR